MSFTISIRISVLTLTCVGLPLMIATSMAQAPSDNKGMASGLINGSGPNRENEISETQSGLEGTTARVYRIQSALDRGADFLVSQQKDDGSISDKTHALAVTSLAIMALASIGHTPGDSTSHADAVRKALDFVLLEEHQNEQGYFGGSDRSRMYGHGITTLMLTEMQGMGYPSEQNHRMQDRAEKALRLIQSAQRIPKQRKSKGGWRYQPNSPDSDLSISVWQLMALRSAKNDGADVPDQSIQLAIDYLRNSFTGPAESDENISRPSGFAYRPGSRTPSFAMTAAGLLAMQVCGQYDSPEARSAAEWLLQTPPNWKHAHAQYGMYYYAQAMHQRGDHYADKARIAVSEMLLPAQNLDGSWQAKGNEENAQGLVYTTALAMLSLSVQKHYLPIYQR